MGKWSPDDTRLIMSSEVYGISDDGFSDEPLFRLSHEPPVHGVYWSHDGSRILLLTGMGHVNVWDGHTGALLWTRQQVEGAAYGEMFGGGWSMDDSKVMAVSRLGVDSMRYLTTIWDAATGEPLDEITFEDVDRQPDAQWSDQTDHLLVWERSIQVWDGAAGAVTHHVALPDPVFDGETGDPAPISQVRWSADGRTFSAKDLLGRWGIWDVETGDLVLLHTEPLSWPGANEPLVWSPVGSRVAFIDVNVYIYELQK